MNKYKLFQVKSEYIREYGFVPLEEARKESGDEKLPREVWKEVFAFEKETAHIDAIDDLEDLYYIFNEQRPDGFTGHSMSVSDIIEAPYGLWYCDSIGFKKVEWKDSINETVV